MPYMNGLVVFPTFFNLTLNFQSFMIWATVSSWPFCYCCCWVYRASPFSPAKKYNQSDCFLRNLCADQEATVRIRHGTIDWFQIGKGVLKGCLLSPCLFNLYAVCIMLNAWLDEAQVGIKIAGRNINNLRYADDITHMAESKEELKSLLMKVKEEIEKPGLKLNIQKWRAWHVVPSLNGK